MEYPQLNGRLHDELGTLIFFCLHSMLQAKGLSIPRVLRAKTVKLSFTDCQTREITVQEALQHARFDVWCTSARIIATMQAAQALPDMAFGKLLISTYFAVDALFAKRRETGRLKNTSLVTIFRAVAQGEHSHVAHYFGDGHQLVRMRKKSLLRKGKFAARRSLLDHLQAVDEHGQVCSRWRDCQRRYRLKAHLFQKLLGLPGFGVYQAIQFWLVWAALHHNYPKKNDAEWALCGPGTRRALCWLR